MHSYHHKMKKDKNIYVLFLIIHLCLASHYFICTVKAFFLCQQRHSMTPEIGKTHQSEAFEKDVFVWKIPTNSPTYHYQHICFLKDNWMN